MGAAISDILASKTIIGVVSQLRGPATLLQDLFNWGIGGSNTDQVTGRRFYYDTFDVTRKIATGRRPGTATATTKPQKVGEVFGVFPRSAERIPLLHEDIMNRRVIGGPIDVLDSSGERYITMQEAYLAQRFNAVREFQTAGMLRGEYVYIPNGDDEFQDFIADPLVADPNLRHPHIKIDFQVPDENKNQLDGNITLSWFDVAADIPGDLYNVNDKLQKDTGWPLQRAICNSDVWNAVLNNTKVKDQSGSSVTPFEFIVQDQNGNFDAIIRAIPWLRWTVLNTGLATGVNPTDPTPTTTGTFTKLIEDEHIVLMPNPTPAIATYQEGSEIVTERSGSMGERFGFYPYADRLIDPSGWELKAIHNGIPALFIPKAINYADVLF